MERYNQINMVPTKIMDAARKTSQRIEAYAQGKDTFRFLFITDVHTGGNNNYLQYDYLKELIPQLGVSFVVNGGDIGLDLGEDKKTSDFILQKTAQGMKNLPCAFFALKGNHDYGVQKIPNDELNHLLNDPMVNHPNLEIVFRPHGGQYGSYWDEKSRTELILLNTTDGDRPNYFMSKDQLSYLINKLSTVKNDSNLLLLSHMDPDVSGSWVRSGSAYLEVPCFVALRQILEDFVERKEGSCLSLSYDFRKVPSSVYLLGCLCGDSHFNNAVKKHGVLYMARQGFGGVLDVDLPLGASKDPFDFQTETNFDVVVFRSDRKAKIFRVGAGDEKRDIELL